MSVLRERLAKKGLDKKKLEAASEQPNMTADRANVLLERKTTSGVDRVQHERPLANLLKRAKTLKTDSKPTVAAEVKPVEKPKTSNSVLDKIRAKKAQDEFKVDTSSLRQPILGEAGKPVIKEKPLSPLAKIKAKQAQKASEAKRIENKKNAVANALAQIDAPPASSKTVSDLTKKPAPKLIASGKPKLSPLERLKAKKVKEAKPAVDNRMDMELPLDKDPNFLEPKPEGVSKLQALLAKGKDKKEVKKGVAECLVAKEVIKQGDAMPVIEIKEKEDSAPQEAATPVLAHAAPAEVNNRAMVTLNERQRLAVEYAVSGGNLCVVGPAGTGKTTTVRSIIKALRDAGKIEKHTEFKRQGGSSLSDRIKDQWSIACVAFTRTAANNLRDSITADPELEDFYWSCQTIHNLLEYYPSKEEVWDEENECYKETMRFIPMRDADNKIDVDVVVIEEGSMVDLILAEKLLAALPEDCQIIYLGDINQLPPVFGLPILAYALHKLRVVELNHVYRQAIGPILNAAHNILKGAMPEEARTEGGIFNLYHDFKTEKGSSSIKSHSKVTGLPVSLGQENCAKIYSRMFELFYGKDNYDPEQDIVLSPWNVRDLGTENMNSMLAQFIGDARNAVVHEIIAGFKKHYLAEGDRVMVDKQAGIIETIHHNSDYVGRAPALAGNSLSRFGTRIMGREDHDIDLDDVDDYANLDLDKMAEENIDEIKKAASHCVTVILDSGESVTLANAGSFSADRFSLGYVLTTHKAQGMEFRKVWIVAHREQSSTITREWLYTAVTRAKQECTIIGHEATIKSALGRQRIKGNNLEEKIESFTGAVTNLEEVAVVP